MVEEGRRDGASAGLSALQPLSNSFPLSSAPPIIIRQSARSWLASLFYSLCDSTSVIRLHRATTANGNTSTSQHPRNYPRSRVPQLPSQRHRRRYPVSVPRLPSCTAISKLSKTRFGPSGQQSSASTRSVRISTRHAEWVESLDRAPFWPLSHVSTTYQQVLDTVIDRAPPHLLTPTRIPPRALLMGSFAPDMLDGLYERAVAKAYARHGMPVAASWTTSMLLNSPQMQESEKPTPNTDNIDTRQPCDLLCYSVDRYVTVRGVGTSDRWTLSNQSTVLSSLIWPSSH